MQFPNASNVPANMMYPTDFSYWEKLKAFVDYEPVGAIPEDVRGILASIGIVKSVPFTPDASAKEELCPGRGSLEVLGYRVSPPSRSRFERPTTELEARAT